MQAAVNSASSANLAGFSQQRTALLRAPLVLAPGKSAIKSCRERENANRGARGLHKICCTPLWTGCTRLIFQQIKHPPFLLTLKLEGVKTTSFFDSF
jgi:hypothetical protein